MKDVNAGEKDKYEGKRRYHENTYFSPSIPVYPKDVRVSHTVNTHTVFFQAIQKRRTEDWQKIILIQNPDSNSVSKCSKLFKRCCLILS